MSPYSDTLSSFRANECVLSGETTIITNCIVFGLTRSGLKPTIYHHQGKNTSNHTTDAVRRYRNRTNAKNEFLYCADNINLDLSRKQCKVSISALHLSTYQCVDVLRHLKVNLFGFPLWCRQDIEHNILHISLEKTCTSVFHHKCFA